MNIESFAARALRSARAAVAVAPVCVLFAACQLDVTTPDIVLPSVVSDPAALPTLLAGTVGDFTAAYSGVNDPNTGEGIVLQSGLFADEFITTDFFSTHVETDSRNQNPPNSNNSVVIRRLTVARASADAVADAYVTAGRPDDAGRARAMNLSAMVYVIIAEDYCSGVPFSSLDANGNLINGQPRSTDEMLATAVAKFDSARVIAAAAGDDQQENVAKIGKGRALLDANDYVGAAAAVAGVPTDFNFSTEQGVTDDRSKSGIFDMTFQDTRFTVADQEGINGLPFVSAEDPRVPTIDLGISNFDGATELFPTLKYASFDAPTAIATGTEARLIEAEATLHAGDYPGALLILKDLRDAAGMDPLLPAVGVTAQEDQLFSERAFWMFGTSHRLGDLRRLVRQYDRNASSVYPAGPYFKGGVYGPQLAMILPLEEQQNPEFSREACDPTKP